MVPRWFGRVVMVPRWFGRVVMMPGGLPAGESRGVDVGEREDPLGRGAVTRGASDHHGSSVHHLLHHSLEVLLGSRSGGGGGCRGGSGGGSLGHFLLCGHGGHSNGHTTDGQNLL